MIEVKNINFKASKGDFSLKDISFTLEDGYMMCLLGRNGAGKTTLLNIMYGMLAADSGEVIYDGKVISENAIFPVDYRQKVAYVGGESWCMENYNMNKNLEILACMYPDFDFDEYERLLSSWGIGDADKNKIYRELSTGQKMQFQMAFAFAKHPKLVIMDEPMSNLDPVIKTDLVETFQEKMSRENMGIIISTHLVDDINDMVDYVGVLDNGSLKVFGDRENVLTDKGLDDLKSLVRRKEV